MRIFFTACLILLLTATTPEAQQGAAPTGEGRQEQGQDMTLNGISMPQRKQTDQQQMMQDMAQVMADIVKVQQRIVESMNRTGKKELLSELQDLTARVNTLVAGMKGMTSQPRPSAGIAGRAAAGGNAAGSGTGRAPGDVGAPRTQEKTDAGVSAKAALESANGTLVFRVALDSETVNINQYRFGESVVLRAADTEYQARLRSEDGAGRHRSAILEFRNPGTREYQIVFKDVAGVAERVFSFPF